MCKLDTTAGVVSVLTRPCSPGLAHGWGGDGSSQRTAPRAIVPGADREALGWERNLEKAREIPTTSATAGSSQRSRRAGLRLFLEGPKVLKQKEMPKQGYQSCGRF